MAKLQLEMGGKNPLVVLDDADLGVAVNCAINGAFFSTGQRCTASSRLIVGAGIHDRFVAALSERLAKLKVDDALAPGTDIGPVVDETQLKQDLEYIGIGQKEGAKLVAGGEVLQRSKKGHYLAPALLTEATNAMRTSREEIFGPVASVIRVKDYDEALAVANDTDFGLSAGIVTTSLKHASHFKRASAGRHGDGQPADRRSRLPRPVRRPERVELRSARAGTLRARVLYGRQDCIHVAVIDRTASCNRQPRPDSVSTILTDF